MRILLFLFLLCGTVMSSDQPNGLIIGARSAGGGGIVTEEKMLGGFVVEPFADSGATSNASAVVEVGGKSPLNGDWQVFLSTAEKNLTKKPNKIYVRKGETIIFEADANLVKRTGDTYLGIVRIDGRKAWFSSDISSKYYKRLQQLLDTMLWKLMRTSSLKTFLIRQGYGISGTIEIIDIPRPT